MIFALTGLGRSGKDTAADHLVDHFGLIKDSFGRSIYEESAPAFGVTIEQMQSNAWKTTPQPELALENCVDDAFVDAVIEQEMRGVLDPVARGCAHIAALEQPRSSRFILQRWATEYRRAQDPLYWVKTLAARMEARLGAKAGAAGGAARHEMDFVIADLREDHEVAYLLAFAGQHHMKMRVIEVLRHGTIKTEHGSDAGLPWKYIDTRIRNAEGEQDAFLWIIRRTYLNIKGIP